MSGSASVSVSGKDVEGGSHRHGPRGLFSEVIGGSFENL